MILLALGCSADRVLSVSDAQMVGTHNSYHVETVDFQPWAYTHPPLDEQVRNGIRQFEIDVWWDGAEWWVYHIESLDEGTRCPTILDCLTSLELGSEQVPAHLPMVVLLEPKTEPEADADRALAALTAAVEDAAGPLDRLTPDAVRGDAPTLREALREGWPALTGQRGRWIPVVHSRSWRDLIADDGPLFVDSYGDLTDDRAAIHSVNDPFDPQIGELVAAGHLVRTRADGDVLEPAAGDTTRRDQALSSGAHFVSTDFPVPHPVTGYQVDLGGPARCNPVRANERCSLGRLEGN